MTPQVFIFIGPICSGKSTKAREAAAAGSIVINDDAIVAMCHGGLYGRYSKSLKHLYKSIEMSMLNSALSLGRDVVVDRPNMPGTVDQWPNWLQTLPEPIEDLLARPLAVEVAEDLARR